MTEMKLRPELEEIVSQHLAKMKVVHRSGPVAKCDICLHIHGKSGDDAGDALVDGPTQPSGSWGFMCRGDFEAWAISTDSLLNRRLVWDDAEAKKAAKDGKLPPAVLGEN